jgi:hypothetical protein
MWSQFRAIAARIGLSREDVEAVERGGGPTLVQDPLNSQVQYRVRPDPDWTQRMSDAWEGVLVNSRRQSVGTIPIRDGRMRIADVSSPDHGVTADVEAGEYEVVLTIAHEGSEEEHDYAEHVSHAFALLCGDRDVAVIEPMTADDGTELGVEGYMIAFAGDGVLERIAAHCPGGRIWTTRELLRSAMPGTGVSDHKSARAVTDDGAGGLVAVNGGYGRGDYPLFRIADPDGNTIGVLLDFGVDNRPHE